MSEDNNFLEVAFNTIDEGITIYDRNLNLQAWNDVYANMGITPRALIYRGANLLETYREVARNGAFGPGDPETLAAEHARALQEGPLVETEILHAADGRQIRVRRFRLASGGVCATFRDVTEENKLAAQLRQTAKLDAIGRFTGGIAHDINNVLAVIIGSLEIALEQPEKSERLMRTALDAAERGGRLTNGLLAFARQKALQAEVVDLTESLAELQRMVPRLVGETIHVSFAVAPGLWPTAIDVNQFDSVILNMAVNAKDAMPNGGQLNISVRNVMLNAAQALAHGLAPGEYVCVTISDTGEGMVPEIARRVFEPFFTTKEPGIGTGLGLSMAQGFAQQSGGAISLHSEPGAGSSFSLYLPRATAQPEVEERSEIAPADLHHLKVLVVEDDDALRESVVGQVASLGCEVVSAANGNEVLARGYATLVDVVLTDVVMPHMSGIELVRTMRGDVPDIGVIFMSGYSAELEFGGAVPRPEGQVLHKPFRRFDLANALSRVAGHAAG